MIADRLRILHSLIPEYGDRKDRDAAHPQDSVKIVQCARLISDVMQNVRCDDEIKTCVHKREIAHVYLIIDVFPRNVGRFVAMKHGSQLLPQAALGGKMERSHLRQLMSFPKRLKNEPDQAVPLQRAATGTVDMLAQCRRSRPQERSEIAAYRT